MNRPVFGLLLGGALGIVDGATALLSAPELAPSVIAIVAGSSVKGLLSGLLTGAVLRWTKSWPLAGLAGALIAFLITLPIALSPADNGQIYTWQILLPGTVLGFVVGYATFTYAGRVRPAGQPR